MKKLILSSLLFTSVLANGAEIRNVIYDENKIYSLYYKTGRTLLIQLAKDETLDEGRSASLGTGDKGGWNIGAKGSAIMIKPAEINANTNLILFTNKNRTYAFDLIKAVKDKPTYIIRFEYPEEQAKSTQEKVAQAQALAQQEKKRKEFVADHTKTRPNINVNYSWRGIIDALKPTAAWDNGRFTYFEYDNSKDLPNFYKKMPDGQEALVNKHIEGNTVVIHDVTDTILVRLGSAVIEVVNTNKNSLNTRFNESNTGSYNEVRESLQ